MNLIFMEKLKTIMIVVFFLIIAGLFAYILYYDILPETSNDCTDIEIYKEIIATKDTEKIETKDEEKEVKKEEEKIEYKYIPYDATNIEYEQKNSSIVEKTKWYFIQESESYLEVKVEDNKISATYFETTDEDNSLTNGKTYEIKIENPSEIKNINIDNKEYLIVLDKSGKLYKIGIMQDNIVANPICENVIKIETKLLKASAMEKSAIFVTTTEGKITEVTSKIVK